MAIHRCPTCICEDKVSSKKWAKEVIRRRQARLLDAATRHGAGWTDAEYRLLDTDLSCQDIAKITGRSFYAVRTKRNRLNQQRRSEAEDARVEVS